MTRVSGEAVARVLLVLCAAALAGVPLAGTAGAEPAAGNREFVLVAGNGGDGYSGDGQLATDARISEDGTIAVGGDGTLYLVDDRGTRIRAVDEHGVIDTVPGTRALRSPENDSPMVNGIGFSPSDRPRAVATGKDGSLYVAGSDTIRRHGPDGSVTVLADTEATGLDFPGAIGVDDNGSVYVGNGLDSGKLVRVDPAGTATTIAGGGSLAPLDADGRPATEARLDRYGSPFAVAPDGTVYLLAGADDDSRDSALYKITPDGILHSITGANSHGFSGDGGPVTEAQLSETPTALAVAPDGTVYLADTGNHLVRTIDRDGVIDSLAPALTVDSVSAMAVGPRGEVYVKSAARVYELRDAAKPPAPGPVREPNYPAWFPRSSPGDRQVVVDRLNAETPAPDDGTEAPNSTLAVGPDGTRYYSDAAAHRVMKVTSDGRTTVFAGTGKDGFSGDGGPATEAALYNPAGLDVGPDGSVYIADSANLRLRKVDPTGVITTVAGNGNGGDAGGFFGEDVTVHGDGGPATAATMAPSDVSVADDGSLYVAEASHYRVRRITPDGIVSTVAGGGERWMNAADGHPATEASFFMPIAVAAGPGGVLYLLTAGADGPIPAVRMVDAAGVMHTVAGDSYRDEDEAGFGGDGGPATAAELNSPHDIAVGQDGTLYVADTYNARIRAVDTAGTITTVAGTGKPADAGDGGAATKAALNEPTAIDVDADGALHVVSTPGDRVRTIADGVVTTTATLPPARSPVQDEVPPAEPGDLAIDHDGTLLALYDNQFGSLLAGAERGDRTAETLDELPGDGAAQAIAVGPDGTRYVAAGDVVYRMPERGPATPMAGGGPGSGDRDQVGKAQPATVAGFESVVDLAVDAKGRLHIATPTNVYRLDDGTLTGLLRNDRKARTHPSGIAVDADGGLFIADSDANRVYEITADGERVTVAGNGSDSSPMKGEDSTRATEVAVKTPEDVAVDDGGNVYVSTSDGIQRVDSYGQIMLVTGEPKEQLAFSSLTVDRNGDLFYVDGEDVDVVVRPGALDPPFDWATPNWFTGVGFALLVAWAFVARHRYRTRDLRPSWREPGTASWLANGAGPVVPKPGDGPRLP